jgi:hypothetical protein
MFLSTLSLTAQININRDLQNSERTNTCILIKIIKDRSFVQVFNHPYQVIKIKQPMKTQTITANEKTDMVTASIGNFTNLICN